MAKIDHVRNTRFMASELKLITKRAKKDGTYPIVVCVGYGRNLYISTKISVRPDEWDETAQIVTNPRKAVYNATLEAIQAATTARVLELRAAGIFDRLDNTQLREMISNTELTEAPAPKVRHTLGKMFSTVMGTKTGRTAEIYRSTTVRLREYCDIDKVVFDDINRLWLDGFVASMSELSSNTKRIHLRNLRAVNNYAIDCGVTNNYPFRRYRMPEATSRKRSFTVDVMRGLIEQDFGHYNTYRDIFLLTFCLIGINFVDLCNLTEVSAEGRVEYFRAKTHKPYSIKVEPEAAELIETLRGKTHLLYMLDNHHNYLSYYRQLRRGLEEVRDRYNARHDVPIAELTTYWARHTWATIARKVGVSVDDIALALGHSDGRDTTHIYINDDIAKIDAANRRVLDWVYYSK